MDINLILVSLGLQTLFTKNTNAKIPFNYFIKEKLTGKFGSIKIQIDA